MVTQAELDIKFQDLAVTRAAQGIAQEAVLFIDEEGLGINCLKEIEADDTWSFTLLDLTDDLDYYFELIVEGVEQDQEGNYSFGNTSRLRLSYIPPGTSQDNSNALGRINLSVGLDGLNPQTFHFYEENPNGEGERVFTDISSGYQPEPEERYHYMSCVQVAQLRLHEEILPWISTKLAEIIERRKT